MSKVCFTGYRPFKLPFEIREGDRRYLDFKHRAERVITEEINRGNTYFISGMAQGADMILAEIVLELKKEREEVFLECALPFTEQSEKWTQRYKADYNRIIKACDKVTVHGEGYSVKGYMSRNMYMVDSSDTVIAVYDGKSGGTKFTCDYAVKKGKRLIVLNPAEETFEQITVNIM